MYVYMRLYMYICILRSDEIGVVGPSEIGVAGGQLPSHIPRCEQGLMMEWCHSADEIGLVHPAKSISPTSGVYKLNKLRKEHCLE